MKTRHFNKMAFDPLLGTLTKSSTDEKIFHEINFIKSVPREISVLFPRIIEDGTDFYKMEFYAYQNLTHYLITDKEFDWDTLFLRINEVLFKFSTYRMDLSEKFHIDFYTEKLISRVNEFLAAFPEFDKDALMINGRSAKGFRKLLPSISDRFRKMYDPRCHAMMHGDFIFGNILYDPKYQVLKFVDPRGSFGDHVGIYGDVRYDYAKLYQSVIGGYDYIISDMFRISLINDQIDYEVLEAPEHVKKLCRQLIRSSGYSEEEIKFITATLFLSMVPLHSEDPMRQRLLFAHGLHLINEIL